MSEQRLALVAEMRKFLDAHAHFWEGRARDADGSTVAAAVSREVSFGKMQAYQAALAQLNELEHKAVIDDAAAEGGTDAA